MNKGFLFFTFAHPLTIMRINLEDPRGGLSCSDSRWATLVKVLVAQTSKLSVGLVGHNHLERPGYPFSARFSLPRGISNSKYRQPIDDEVQ